LPIAEVTGFLNAETGGAIRPLLLMDRYWMKKYQQADSPYPALFHRNEK
jgi:hypothetical protein